MRTSTTTTQKHENVAPLPIYPFLFNPYYHPTIYSRYIPLSYDESTRLIPISQLPYPLLVPTQLPHGSTHIPSVKNPMRVKTNIPPINQIDIQKYDQPEEKPVQENTTENLLNQNHSEDFNYAVPIVIYHKEPINIDQEKYEESEKQNPKMDQFQNPMTTELTQINKSQEIQQPLSSTTVIELDVFTPPDEIHSSKTYNMTSTQFPITVSEIFNLPDILRNSVTQLPQKTKYNLSSDEFSKITQFYSSTKERPETKIETESVTNKNNKSEKTSIFENQTQLNQPQKDLPYLKSSNNIDKTILESSIKFEENPTEITKTTSNSEAFITLSTSQQPVITLPSSSLCENNDCQTSKSLPITTPDIDTTLPANSYNSSAQIKSVYSTKDNNEYDNQLNLIKSTTHRFPTSTGNSEIMAFPYSTSKSSTITSLSSMSSPETSTLFKPSNAIKHFNKNNEIQSTSLLYTTLLSTLQPLNNKNIITSPMLTETITEETSSTSSIPPVTIHYDDYTTNIKNNTNIPIHYDKSTTSSSSSIIISRSSFPQPEKTFQNNLPSDVNNFSKSYLDGFFLTGKTNMHKDDNTNHNFLVTTVGTRSNSLKPIATTITPRNSIQRKLPLVTISSNLKNRKSTNDQDRVISKPKPLQTYNDSELWYNHMHTQKTNKKELSEEQIDFLLKKIIKLLKPEIEKQIITKESISRLVVPKLGDQEKLIQIILPLVRDAAKNIENEERKKKQ